MSNEEALKGFANYCKECRTNAQTFGADVVCGVCKVFVAKQALEKQIPKKPKPIDELYIETKSGYAYTVNCICKKCHAPLVSDCIPTFCAHCGQRLKLGDEDD